MRIPSYALALVAFGPVAEVRAQAPSSPVAGTYQLVVCKTAPCTPRDTANALTWGVLVLADSALPFAALPDSARRLLHSDFLRGPANGCYALHRAGPRVETYAGIAGAGTTHWQWNGTGGPIVFSLYRSPDAGHVVRAFAVRDTLRGTGESSGAGVAEVHYPRDTVVAIRVGPPSVAPCAEASAREWRRIRSKWPPT